MTRKIKSKPPLCSVCIANYNGANVLEVCLKSVFRQDFPGSMEVIVHDDASTDESVVIVKDRFPEARLIRSDRNVGFCISNNRMVAEAKGQYILLLNNDAALHENALSTLYNYAVTNDLYGIIGLPQYDMATGVLLDMGSFLDPFLNPVPNKQKIRHHVGMVSGACMWLPKKLWNELGGFPEWFESIAEDMYLCCRARLKGYPVIALSQSGFDHRVGQSFGGGKVVKRTLRTTYRRRALSERNKTYVMFLCYPGLAACVLMPLHLLLLALEGFALTAIKRDRRIWMQIYKPCFRAFWNNRIEIMRMRRDIQSKTIISIKTFYSEFIFVPHKLSMLLRYGMPKIKL